MPFLIIQKSNIKLKYIEISSQTQFMEKRKINNNKNHQISKSKTVEKSKIQNLSKSIGKDRSKTKQEQEKNKNDENIVKDSQKNSEERKNFTRPISSSKTYDFDSELENKYKDLKIKKQKMYACIDLFNLMQSNNMQLRCMQHNNILTLYCISERKILCVNCTYGGNRHRTHKIIPLKDSSKFINEDNQILKDMLNSDLKKLEQSIKNCQQNTNTLERELKKSLMNIQQQFQKRFDDLKAKYQYQTSKIKNTYESLIEKNRFLEKDIEQFKFKIWQTLSKIGIGRRNQLVNNQTQIIRQVFCVNISQLTKFEIGKMSKRQIQKIIQKIRN